MSNLVCAECNEPIEQDIVERTYGYGKNEEDRFTLHFHRVCWENSERPLPEEPDPVEAKLAALGAYLHDISGEHTV